MGTEEFWIPAVLAAVGTGANAINTKNANNRADTAQAQSIMDQQAIQQKAGAATKQTVDAIQNSSPQKIADTATGAYVAQLRKNAAAPGSAGSALAPAVGGSSRYKNDVTTAATG